MHGLLVSLFSPYSSASSSMDPDQLLLMHFYHFGPDVMLPCESLRVRTDMHLYKSVLNRILYHLQTWFGSDEQKYAFHRFGLAV